MGNFAPVCIFVYNRPVQTKKILEALLKNSEAKETEVYFFCDGPKSIADQQAVLSVKALARSAKGFKKTSIIEREENLGLANNILHGVSHVVSSHGRAIVLEDDILVSPHFLAFMNEGLDRYRDDTAVAAIHGYTPPIEVGKNRVFFIRGADCWGWATWERAWNTFERDGAKLLKRIQLENLSKGFDLDFSFPYTKMLKEQTERKNQSWAIRWQASCYLNKMYCAYPPKSLVANIGFDGSGTHSKQSSDYEVSLSSEAVSYEWPRASEDENTRAQFASFYRNIPRGKIQRLVKILKSLLFPKVDKS